MAQISIHEYGPPPIGHLLNFDINILVPSSLLEGSHQCFNIKIFRFKETIICKQGLNIWHDLHLKLGYLSLFIKKDLHWQVILRRGFFSEYCEYQKYIDVKIVEHYPIVILGIILTRRHGRADGQNCINFKIVQQISFWNLFKPKLIIFSFKQSKLFFSTMI